MAKVKAVALLFFRGVIIGAGIFMGLGATALLAVTVSGKINEFSAAQVVSAAQINENFTTLRTALETTAHGDHSPPVGTIMAWHKDLTNVPSLPNGWLECNGQTVSDTASVLDGVTLPDLNGQGRFLRGSGTSGTNQAYQFTQHTHRNNIMVRAGMAVWNNLSAGWTDLGVVFGGVSGLANSASAINPHVGFAGTPGETRPVNMSVVWIMRVK